MLPVLWEIEATTHCIWSFASQGHSLSFIEAWIHSNRTYHQAIQTAKKQHSATACRKTGRAVPRRVGGTEDQNLRTVFADLVESSGSKVVWSSWRDCWSNFPKMTHHEHISGIYINLYIYIYIYIYYINVVEHCDNYATSSHFHPWRR